MRSTRSFFAMPRQLCSYAFLLLGFSLLGCAATEPVTSNYSERNNQTRFETRTINTGHHLSGSALGSSREVILRAVAVCDGQNCTPGQVRLFFLVSGGSNPIQFPDRSVIIQTDTQTHNFSQEAFRDAERSTRLGRHIMTIEMDASTFIEMAYSNRFDVTIGSRSFSLAERSRSPLRLLSEAAGLTDRES